MLRIIKAISDRPREFIAAGFAVLAVAGASVTEIWVFRRGSAPRGSSFWESILADRATVGFLRAAFVMLALYSIASAAALIATGRWIRTLKTSGFEADDPRALDAALRDLRAEFEAAKQERDEAQRLLWRYLHG
ncbi:MAG: hypothetical protein WEB06_13685 [Actinomycetota bacterium]